MKEEYYPCEIEHEDGWMWCPYEILQKYGIMLYPNCQGCAPVLILDD